MKIKSVYTKNIWVIILDIQTQRKWFYYDSKFLFKLFKLDFKTKTDWYCLILMSFILIPSKFKD